jgi:hypothetical protein
MLILDHPGRAWAVAARAAWLVLGVYVVGTVLLVDRYQPKVVAERVDSVAADSLYSTIGGQLYWALAPLWQYNRYIVPILALVAVGLTVAARLVGNHEESCREPVCGS